MSRLFAVVFAALLVFVSAAVTARDAPEGQLASLPADDADDVTMVEGIAIGDLLNVRAKASPFGKVLGRLPNGSILRKHECETVDGYEWCRIDALESDGLSGWAPARYLRGLDIRQAATGAIEPGLSPADVAEDDASLAAALQAEALPAEQAAGVPVPTPSPLRAEAVAQAEPQDGPAAGAGVPLPPGLETRFGDSPSPSALTLAGASETAYFLALRDAAGAGVAAFAPVAPATIEPVLPDLPAASPAPAAADTAPAPEVPTEATLSEDEAPQPAEAAAEAEPVQGSAWSVPTPTPRPQRDGERVALLDLPVVGQPRAPAPVVVVAQANARTVTQSAPAGTDAAGEIPCARYVGQPMTRCVASVVRHGDNSADVRISWPDGGDRVISFRDGVPAGANSRHEFRVSREGNLNLIRIGLSERFEIVDAVVFGD